jgi:hypothetical protein
MLVSSTAIACMNRHGSLTGYTECAAHPSMSSCGKHWWDEDVEAFRSKLTTFKPKSCGPDGVLDDTRVTVSEFLARERKMVAGIQEVIVSQT